MVTGSKDDVRQEDGKFTSLVIPQAPRVILKLGLVGTRPLLSHAKNEERMVEEMAYNRQRYNKGEKPPKPKPLTPFQEFIGTLYLLPGQEHQTRELKPFESWTKDECAGRYGFKKDSFMGSILTASMGFHTGYNPAHVKSIEFHGGEFLPLKYDEIQMRVDLIEMPSRAKSEKGREEEHRSKRPVVRASISNWACDLSLSYRKNLFTDPKEVIALFVTAGESIGVGSGRKEKKGGDFGTFRVDTAEMMVEKS